MNIDTAEKSFQDLTYGDDSFNQLLDQLQHESIPDGYRLILFAGKDQKSKQKALRKIAERTGRQVRTVDGNELITKIESETFKNIEHELSHLDTGGELLFIKNGGRLNGSYTGYTNSKVKYATPQERFFFKAIQDTGGFYVVDLQSIADGDTTLHRAARAVISFPGPQSFFGKMMWNLTHITVNGSDIRTLRPKRGGEPSGNFK